MRHLYCGPAVLLLALSGSLLCGLPAGAQQQTERPNVLWLTCEDISPNLGCYGDEFAITPTLDALAQQGIRYTSAVGICGVCAVNRSCLITGMYSSTIGSQDMRSKIRLPACIPTYSKLLRQAGYYCTNNSKTDYNFPTPKDAWDASSGKAHWRNRKQDQPFFAVFNYTGSHESQVWEANHKRHAAKLTKEERHDPQQVPVPPFHPDTPEVRRDWANYYDNITALDHWIAQRLKELEDAGLAEETIVFFYSDHGAGMPMCKKWVWDWGLRIPLLVRFPEQYQRFAPGPPGSTTDRLVSFVDFAPTLLSLVGVEIPPLMQGRAFLGNQEDPPRDFAFAIRDRMAEWYDVVRVVRDSRFQYHRNFMPHIAWAPFCSYTLTMPTAQVATRLHEQGTLTPAQERFFQPKPTEELYDLTTDPHMLNNLADQPEYADIVERMRNQLHHWQLRTRDLGLMSEYEMHRRAADSTQYDVGQSEEIYPLRRILPIAELASDRNPDNIPQLLKALADEEPIVRWWAVQGLVMLGDPEPDVLSAFQSLVKDESPLVRVAAAEGLYRSGDAAAALEILKKELEHDTPFVRLRALTALYQMGSDARPALPSIKKASMKGVFPAEYANRLIQYMPQRMGNERP